MYHLPIKIIFGKLSTFSQDYEQENLVHVAVFALNRWKEKNRQKAGKFVLEMI